MILGLAPMADYTDPAFRKMCGKYGANYAITEMVSSEALIRGKIPETVKVLGKKPKTIVQIFGSNPKNLLKAGEHFEKSFKEINLNAGCPVPKVVKKGAGSALLKTPEKLGEIVEILSGSLKSKISVKIRLGYDDTKDALKIAKIIEKNGADSIIVHARTRKQGYSGNADWKFIKKIKQNSGIIIFGNGDVKNWEDAYKMKKETKCDGIYIGRAAVYNPLIFKEIKEKKNILMDEKKIKKLFLEYCKIVKKNKLEKVEIKAMAMGFCKGFEGAKELRGKITQTKEKKDIIKLFES